MTKNSITCFIKSPFNDTFIRPRQKHKQQSSTIYKKYEKKKKEKKLDQRNVREVPKQTFCQYATWTDQVQHQLL